MQLSARILKDVQGVNSFDYAEAAEFTEGDTPVIYFQILDLGKDSGLRGFMPAGRRYMPAAGATLQITLDNTDDAKKFVRAATQPFATDPSIWRIETLTTDKLRGTIAMRLLLTEGSVITRGSLKAAILVRSAR